MELWRKKTFFFRFLWSWVLGVGCYGTCLHGNGQFLLNIYRLYLTHGKITSELYGAYALLSGRYWPGTHFDRPRFIGAHIWSGVSWFQWQSVEVRLDWHPRISGEAYPQALNLLGGARFIAWSLRRLFLEEYRRGPRHFWKCRACLDYGPVPDPPKKGPSVILVRLWDGRQIPIAAWQYLKDTPKCCITPVFCDLFCYCNIFVSTYFSCQRIFI